MKRINFNRRHCLTIFLCLQLVDQDDNRLQARTTLIGHFYGEVYGEQCVKFQVRQDKLLKILKTNIQKALFYSGKTFVPLIAQKFNNTKNLKDYFKQLLNENKNSYWNNQTLRLGSLCRYNSNGLKNLAFRPEKISPTTYHDLLIRNNEKIEQLNK